MAPARQTFRTVLLFASTLVLFLSVGGAAHAQDFDAAGKHFAAGQERFAAQRFHTAALHFQAAYDITKDPVLLFNVGESWQNAGDADHALAAYRAYIEQKPTAQDRPDVEKRIALLSNKKTQLADQSATGDKAEADAILASGAPAPLPADVAVAAAPAAPEVAAPAPPPAPIAATEPPAPKPAPAVQIGLLDDKPSTKLRIAAWSGVAATIALLTTGAILGLAAQSRADEITRRLNFTDASGQPVQYDSGAKSDFQDLRNEGHVYNGLAIGFYSASAAMAIVTTTLFLVDWRHKKKRDADHALRPRLLAMPTFGQNSGGAVIGGTF